MNRSVRLADSAGAFGAILAALCCAGAPLILAGLAALNLTFIRKDAILLPVMIVSLLVALWGFWSGFRAHGKSGPLILAAAGAAALTAGVIFVHGFPAKQLIGAGALALVVAPIWNIMLRRSCNPEIA
jgi:hypothetical protein